MADKSSKISRRDFFRRNLDNILDAAYGALFIGAIGEITLSSRPSLPPDYRYNGIIGDEYIDSHFNRLDVFWSLKVSKPNGDEINYFASANNFGVYGTSIFKDGKAVGRVDNAEAQNQFDGYLGKILEAKKQESHQ